jgi:YggT family protein
MIGSAFLKALFYILIYIISIYKWIIVIRALISWVSPDPYNPIVRALVAVTEPTLKPFRKIISPYKTGGIDFSPLFVFLILQFFEIFLKNLYFEAIKTI